MKFLFVPWTAAGHHRRGGDTLKLIQLPAQKETIVGEGSFLQSAQLPDNTIFSVWEQDNAIKFRKE